MTAHAGIPTDRMKVADLAVRVARLREGLPPGHRAQADLINLSGHQLDLIVDGLHGLLTAMTLHGYCWFRDVPEPTPRRVESMEARQTMRAEGAG